MTKQTTRKFSVRAIIILSFFGLLSLAMLVGGFIALYQQQHAYELAITVSYDSESIAIKTPTKTVTTKITDITEITFSRTWDYNCTLLNGEDSEKLACGIYQIDDYEAFQMYRYKENGATIVLNCIDGYIAFNVSDEAETEALYQSIKGVLFPAAVK